MGRGKDKTISLSDLRSMGGAEFAALGNLAKMRALKFSGTAVVRDRQGNARYEEPGQAGKYGEENVS